MRVKICGLMRPQDVRAAVESGSDALGFVVDSPSSPRNLDLNRARGLMKGVPIFAAKVAVTSTNKPKTVLKICSRLRPDAVQLHNYSQSMLRAIRKKHPSVELILATAIRNQSSVITASRTASYSDAVLADSAIASRMGGTGLTHDWSLTARVRGRIYPHPLILAGGLTPSNVRVAIRKVKPFAVDVATGVERAPGVKDHQKIREFIHNAKGYSY